MIRLYFSPAGLRRVVLEAPSASGREFDLAALIALRPYLLAADRALSDLAHKTLQSQPSEPGMREGMDDL
jgi:hypothetical protein